MYTYIYIYIYIYTVLLSYLCPYNILSSSLFTIGCSDGGLLTGVGAAIGKTIATDMSKYY